MMGHDYWAMLIGICGSFLLSAISFQLSALSYQQSALSSQLSAVSKLVCSDFYTFTPLHFYTFTPLSFQLCWSRCFGIHLSSFFLSLRGGGTMPRQSVYYLMVSFAFAMFIISLSYSA